MKCCSVDESDISIGILSVILFSVYLSVTKLFESLTEDSIDNTLAEASLEDEEFQNLTQQLLQLYNPSQPSS